MRAIAGPIVVAIALLASSAQAQLADARRQLGDADFERAIRSFDRAERSPDLDRADLVSIYEGRAMARWATGDEAHAQRDLRALGSLDPDHRFPPEAPPELARALAEEVRTAGRLSVDVQWNAAGTTMRVRVEHDVAELVRSIRTHVRVGRGAWRVETSTTIELDATPDERVETWVEAIGPGGVVVARSGTESAPLSHGGPPPAIVGTAMESDSMTHPVTVIAPEHHDDAPVIIGVVVGIALVGAVVAVVLVFTLGVGTTDLTQPAPPMVAF